MRNELPGEAATFVRQLDEEIGNFRIAHVNGGRAEAVLTIAARLEQVIQYVQPESMISATKTCHAGRA